MGTVHHHHAVGHAGNHTEVVGDEDHRGMGALTSGGEHFEHLGLHGHVEGGGRLVGDDQIGIAT